MHVGKRDTHYRHRQQSSLMLDHVAHDEYADNEREQHGDFEIFRDKPSGKGPCDEPRCRVADETRYDDREKDRRHDIDQRGARLLRDAAEIFIGHHGA